jgi:2-polyprenyl-3-methyl-5-hydroxy-6-metoxy-1,4-benzoquinol methylase
VVKETTTKGAWMTDTSDDLGQQIGGYADRLFTTGLAALEAATIAIGRQLGLYGALAERGPLTPPELAAAAGIDARYAREWLEQQAVAGWIDIDESTVAADPDDRRYALSTAANECLLTPESLASVGPLFDFVPAVGATLPAVVDAFRTGGGVAYADYAVHDAQGDFNRPVHLNLLAGEWLPSVPGLVDTLAAEEPARVAEIGCGEGWAAIAIARAWPRVRVDGFDLDEASIAAARKHAADAGVADRVRFEVADVTTGPESLGATEPYDLVLAFEMIHDLANPQAALSTMRHLAGRGGVCLVVDENAAETFEAPADNPVERLFYAASVLHCLPVGMADAPSARTGTVMRPATLRRYAEEAGFARVDVLPIEHEMFRFYRLDTE